MSRPRPAGWLAAASEVPVSVLVGTLDTDVSAAASRWYRCWPAASVHQ